jgi:hypothetical protein
MLSEPTKQLPDRSRRLFAPVLHWQKMTVCFGQALLPLLRLAVY